MKQLLLAIQFLTIFPLRVKGSITEKEIAQSAALFPLAGAFQGMLALLGAMVFLMIFPPEITAGLIILILAVSNGGFHLDGLADTFDALSVKSTGDSNEDINKRLEVMKDSKTGAIGVVAIVSVFLLKFLFLSRLLEEPSLSVVYSMLFLMPVFSKWVMVVAMYYGRPARQDGLGRIFLNNVNIKTLLTCSILVIILSLVSLVDFLRSHWKEGITLFVTMIALLYNFSFMAVKCCEKKFNGLTGDNLGAINEISEILFLMVVTVWLQHFI